MFPLCLLPIQVAVKPLASLPLACCIWLDAHGRTDGEFTADDVAREFHRPVPIKTFGLLVCDDERGVTIAQEITSEDEGAPPTYRGLGFIPRGMLKELILLGVPTRTRRRKAKDGADSGLS